jgi:hypothetical protein
MAKASKITCCPIPHMPIIFHVCPAISYTSEYPPRSHPKEITTLPERIPDIPPKKRPPLNLRNHHLRNLPFLIITCQKLPHRLKDIFELAARYIRPRETLQTRAVFAGPHTGSESRFSGFRVVECDDELFGVALWPGIPLKREISCARSASSATVSQPFMVPA